MNLNKNNHKLKIAYDPYLHNYNHPGDRGEDFVFLPKRQV